MKVLHHILKEDRYKRNKSKYTFDQGLQSLGAQLKPKNDKCDLVKMQLVLIKQSK